MLTYNFFMNNTYYIYISAAGRKRQRETARDITHERVGTSIQRACGLLPPEGAAAIVPTEADRRQAGSSRAPAQPAPAVPPAGSDHESSESSDRPDPPSAGAVAANGKRKK